MKKQFYLRMSVAIVAMLCLVFPALNAQERNLKTEILVYILPDSLEIPKHEKGKLSLQRVNIKSSSLTTAMTRSKTTGISKAFPDWADKDSLAMRSDGLFVKMPSFQRVFTLTFDTEKHTDPSLENDPFYGSSRNCVQTVCKLEQNTKRNHLTNR